MTSRVIHRPARTVRGPERPRERTLAPPAPLGDAPSGIPMQSLLPVVGSLSSIVMMTVLRSNPLMVVIGALILVVALLSGLGMAFSSRGRQNRARRQGRSRYLHYLDGVREEYRELHDRVRAESHLASPSAALLPQCVAQPARLWERRPGDADFLLLRAATGRQEWFDLRLPEDPNPVQPFDPFLLAEAARTVETASRVDSLPIAVPLAPGAVVTIIAPPEQGRSLARSLVSQLVVQHAPEEVLLAAAIDPAARDEWRGIDLLPHLRTPGIWDGPLPARSIAHDPAALAGMLGAELENRAARARRGRERVVRPETPLIALCDFVEGPAKPLVAPAGVSSAECGISSIVLVADRLHEPEQTTTRITVDVESGETRIEHLGAEPGAHPASTGVRHDAAAVELFERLCHALAPLRLSAEARAQTATDAEVGTLDILGVERIQDLSGERWGAAAGRGFLTTVIGSGPHGAPVSLDLKEAAQGGMGPHGICIGATGSGKSEFLRTLVLGLAASHGPDDLAMILVDYKGGAAFSPFQPLPQVAGVIDNLEGEAGLIERARASISGEIVRRQQQLKDAGMLASITEYRAARELRPSLEPMPHLLIVLDEFGELLTAEPEFIDLLLQIGRIGRSIGVHMLLSSQRIEAGKLRGLDTFLSYRIGLRTFSEQESHTVLGTPDAFHLPSAPGGGYLKVDSSVYTRFQSGFVSGPLPGPDRLAEEVPSVPFPLPDDNSIEVQLAAYLGRPAPVPDERRNAPTVVEESVRLLRDGAPPTASIWLPPLPARFPLLSVIDSERKPLEVPVGLIDDPARQHQGPWTLDLDRAGGHFAVIGSPQSGRSTFLRTVAAGISTTMPPTRATVYALDLTGAGLTRIAGFPHVGGVGVRGDVERQTRMLEELHGMLRQRERLFRELQIESLGHFRALHGAGRVPGIVSADVVLIVDGYGLARTEFTMLEEPLSELLQRGGSFGIHLVFSLTRWAELPMRLQPLVGNRIELRLNDPGESTIARKLAATITQPGRALTGERLFAQVALPTADTVPDELVGESLAELAERTAASWTGPSAAPVRLLPEVLDVAELPGASEEPLRLPFGLRQDTMDVCALDLENSAGQDQHLLVLGDSGSGKTNLLSVLLDGLVTRRTPEEAVVALMSPRGTLADQVPEDYLGGSATDGRRARELSAALALELEKRRLGEASPELRIYAVVDDFDVLAAGSTAPLEPLLPYLPQARDLGLTVWVTRPVAGAARALYEPALQMLRDLGATGVLLSGERGEGQLWPGVVAHQAIPGRARILRRGEPPRLIQIAVRGADLA